jgi:hypothetical protein
VQSVPNCRPIPMQREYVSMTFATVFVYSSAMAARQGGRDQIGRPSVPGDTSRDLPATCFILILIALTAYSGHAPIRRRGRAAEFPTKQPGPKYRLFVCHTEWDIRFLRRQFRV